MNYIKKVDLYLSLFLLGIFILSGEAMAMKAIVPVQPEIIAEEYPVKPQYTPRPVTNIPKKPKIGKLNSVEECLSMAELCLKKGMDSEEYRYSNRLHQPNFALANKYYSRAYEISKGQRSDVLLRYGWFKYKLPTDKVDGRELIEKGFTMEPDNPEALYMMAVCLYEEYDDKYSINVEKQWENGTPYILSKLEYDQNRDNALLGEAQAYLQKAIKLKSNFANAYYQLNKIYTLKGEREKGIQCCINFLENLDEIDMSLYLFYEQAKIWNIKKMEHRCGNL